METTVVVVSFIFEPGDAILRRLWIDLPHRLHTIFRDHLAILVVWMGFYCAQHGCRHRSTTSPLGPNVTCHRVCHDAPQSNAEATIQELFAIFQDDTEIVAGVPYMPSRPRVAGLCANQDPTEKLQRLQLFKYNE